MSSLAAMSLAMPGSALPYCTPTSSILVGISNTFHTCIPTPLALISTSLGFTSALTWLFSQLPQVYKNYKLQSTAGLSLFFVLEWFFGDLTNLLGAIFTDQAGWQVVVGGYFVFVDICLLSQFSWYGYIKPRMGGGIPYVRKDDDADDDDSIINGLSPINSHFRHEAFPPSTTEMAKTKGGEASRDVQTRRSSEPARYGKPSCTEKSVLAAPSQPCATKWPTTPSARTLLSIGTSYALLSRAAAAAIPSPTFFPPSSSSSSSSPPPLHPTTSPIILAGTILSWTSTVLYLLSRLPQIHKNFSRKSTAGLSPLLFASAFSGNLFYSTSLLTNPNGWSSFPPHGGHGWAGPHGSDRLVWVKRALPFWLGAAGALLMDGLVGCQFLAYSDSEARRGKVVVTVVNVGAVDASGRSSSSRSRSRRRRGRRGRRGGMGEGPRWERVSGWMRGWIPSMGARERVVGLEESQRLLEGVGTSHGTSSSTTTKGNDYGSL